MGRLYEDKSDCVEQGSTETSRWDLSTKTDQIVRSKAARRRPGGTSLRRADVETRPYESNLAGRVAGE